MSGNQYVYVVEERGRQHLTSPVTLVTKNRKNAMAALDRLQKKYEEKFSFRVADKHSTQYGHYHKYVSRHNPVCTVEMRRMSNGMSSFVLAVTVWVIKWAKEEAPRASAYEATGSTEGAFP